MVNFDCIAEFAHQLELPLDRVWEATHSSARNEIARDASEPIAKSEHFGVELSSERFDSVEIARDCLLLQLDLVKLSAENIQFLIQTRLKRKNNNLYVYTVAILVPGVQVAARAGALSSPSLCRERQPQVGSLLLLGREQLRNEIINSIYYTQTQSRRGIQMHAFI